MSRNGYHEAPNTKQRERSTLNWVATHAGWYADYYSQKLRNQVLEVFPLFGVKLIRLISFIKIILSKIAISNFNEMLYEIVF